jgi:hypothetical protein
MSVFTLLVIVHALAATVSSGGHLELGLGMRPRALRVKGGAAIRSFEETFEPLGFTALAIQVLTRVWMGWIYLPGFRGAAHPPTTRSGCWWASSYLLLASPTVGPGGASRGRQDQPSSPRCQGLLQHQLGWSIQGRHERLPPLLIQLEALASSEGFGPAG